MSNYIAKEFAKVVSMQQGDVCEQDEAMFYTGAMATFFLLKEKEEENCNSYAEVMDELYSEFKSHVEYCKARISNG